MEYQFENVCEYDLERALEFQYKIGARRIMFWGAVSAVLTLLYLYRALTGPLVWLIPAAIFLGLSVHYFTWPYRFLKKGEKRMLEYYDGEIPPTYIRFGDQIVVEDVDSRFTLEYRKLDKVISLKRGYYLRYAKKSLVALDPNGFTKGTFAEFKQFLREKRPDLNIPD